MFTQNFESSKQLALCGSGLSSSLVAVKMINTSGTVHNSLYSGGYPIRMGKVDNTFTFSNFLYTQAYAPVMWIGSGSAEESENDITFATDPTQAVSAENVSTAFTSSEVTSTSYTALVEYDEGKASVKLSRTFRAETDITVREIGITNGLQVGSTSGSAEQFLIWRKVLEEEKTYSAGDVFTISVIIEI